MRQPSMRKRIEQAVSRIISERADNVIDGNRLYVANGSDAIPFFVNKYDGTVLFGDFGTSHYDTMIDSDTEMSDTEVVLGRYWTNSEVMGFWFIIPNPQIVDIVVDALKQHLNIAVDKSNLRVVVDDKEPHREGFAMVDHHLVSYTDLVNGDLECKYQEPEHYKKAYATHLADMQTKREEHGDYLSDRSQSLGRKLSMSNGREMSKAEWDSLHRTSESQCR